MFRVSHVLSPEEYIYMTDGPLCDARLFIYFFTYTRCFFHFERLQGFYRQYMHVCDIYIYIYIDEERLVRSFFFVKKKKILVCVRVRVNDRDR